MFSYPSSHTPSPNMRLLELILSSQTISKTKVELYQLLMDPDSCGRHIDLKTTLHNTGRLGEGWLVYPLCTNLDKTFHSNIVHNFVYKSLNRFCEGFSLVFLSRFNVSPAIRNPTFHRAMSEIPCFCQSRTQPSIHDIGMLVKGHNQYPLTLL